MATYGIPQEVMDLEMRVGLTPAGVLALTQAGHTVYIEKNAGLGARFHDEDYQMAGAEIVYNAEEVYGRSEIIVKIARPTVEEHVLFQPKQTIFSFLHLVVAPPELYQVLSDQKITAVAYETITDQAGTQPVLLSTSEIAGRMAPIIAGLILRSDLNGLGILLNGIPGVPPAVVVILGAGVLGTNAARAFVGLGAEVVVLDHDANALRELEKQVPARITTMFANTFNLQRATQFADVLIGAVHTPGNRAPIIVDRKMVQNMRRHAVIIDFSIDEGGCVETSYPTTLRDPTYLSEHVIHHCVPNVTSMCARTTSYAISNAALPYLAAIGEYGLPEALNHEPSLRAGINLYKGELAHPEIATSLGQDLMVKLPPIGDLL